MSYVIELTPEQLAEQFHETYERLAPIYNYKTRKASAVPWEKVPESNKSLMIAVCREILSNLKSKIRRMTVDEALEASKRWRLTDEQEKEMLE